MKSQIRYRGCTISRNWITTKGIPRGDEFSWVHDEYDGAPDGNRWAGWEQTLEMCIDAIDEMAEECISEFPEYEYQWKTSYCCSQ